jgi:hypothetical protein
MPTQPLFNTQLPIKVQEVEGSDFPAQYYFAPTFDGLYVPYVFRTPSAEGKFPFVFLAYGNGGVGLDWLQDRVQRFDFIMQKFLESGYACAWGRYRSEVELGYNTGAKLVIDRRQGMDLLNRGPLEYEDEVAILRHVAKNPLVDPNRLGHVGVSHAGEMLFKIGSQYNNLIRAGVACEPANHEFLSLRFDDSSFINPDSGLRNLEEMVMSNPAFVRSRIDEHLSRERMNNIDFPMLVMGRDKDHLQGIFRTSYDVMKDLGKNVEWVSWDHPLHGYIFPMRNELGTIDVDHIQIDAIDGLIAFLDQYLK